MSVRFMRPRRFWAFLVVFLALPLPQGAEPLPRHRLEGVWREERFDIVLNFGNDGRYVLLDRNGERSGRFSILENFLFPRDSATKERKRFGIADFGPGSLVLHDSRGTEYRFKRNDREIVGKHPAMRLAGSGLSDPPLAVQGEKSLPADGWMPGSIFCSSSPDRKSSLRRSWN